MADTPVFGNPAGLIGRVNVGGGGTLKIAAGRASIRQASGSLIVTVDFVPLMIFTTAPYMTFSDEYGSKNGDYSNVSYRASTSDDFTNSRPTGAYVRGVYDAATSSIKLKASAEYRDQTLSLDYVVMGV